MAVTCCSKLMGRPNTVINLDGCSSGEIMEVFHLLDLVKVRWCSGERLLDHNGTISMVSDMRGELWLSLDIEGDGKPKLTQHFRGFFLTEERYKHNIISVDYLKFLIEDHLYEAGGGC